MKKYILEITEKQANAISNACDIVARLYTGQVQELQDVGANIKVTGKEHDTVKSILFPQLPLYGSYGIHSPEVDDTARQLFDIHQVIRHRIIWDKADNTPETRRWPEQIQIWYDTPSKTSLEEELPTIEQVKK